MLCYIDPGTGSMLFTILIGVITAGLYALRSAIIKLRFVLGGGRHEKTEESYEPFAVFTDDKRYWNVFEPICDEFESRGLRVKYFTSSPDDPALERDYEHVACEFVGEGNKGFATLNMLKADVVLSSTPGLDVYQWKRSRDVKWYAHILHAVSDATMYRMFGIDYYDAVLLTGEYQQDQIRELERLRDLPAKELPVVGLSYMDAMKARLDERAAFGRAPRAGSPATEGDGSGDDEVPTTGEAADGGGAPVTVLLAPSWGASAIFSLYGGSIIDALLQTGYHVVIRPHPQSMKSERDMMDGLMAGYPESERLEWNFDNDNFDVLARSDILVSDFSGVIFDFALVFDRPIIYTEPSYDKAPYDACWLDDEPWTFKVLPRIGRKLEMDHLGDMKELIDSCLGDPAFQRGRDEARDECWGCRGGSAKAVVDYLVAKQAELVANQAPEAKRDGDEKPKRRFRLRRAAGQAPAAE